MACFANVELKQVDQLLKEISSENTHRSFDVAWNVWKRFLGMIKQLLDAAMTDIKFI